MVKAISDNAEFKKIIADNKDKLVVVDFHATWCGPCKMIAPKLVKMAEEYKDVLFFKVDVDELEDTATENEISAMPTFKFFKNGNAVETLQGANEASIRAAIEKLK